MAAQRVIVPILAVAAVALAVFAFWPRPQAPALAAMVDVTLPAEFTSDQAAGAALFAQTCATCHGENGAGVEHVGPPLVHIIYEPSHHPDGAFYAAVQLGVRAHHWDYGDMPRQPEVSEQQIAQIIAYIRALQRENGIH
ncbi:MAG: cytochrome c [Rhodobacteraceae bacterium]|nr:cytochrome c [Paracoccaceae bacterium]